MSHSSSDDTKLNELIAGEVLGYLSDEERDELAARRTEADPNLLFELEATAAAVQLMDATSQTDPLPESLARRIRSDAMRHVGPSAQRSSLQIAAVDVSVDAGDATESSPSIEAERSASETFAATSAFPRRELLAWLSLAASLLIIFGLLRTNQNPVEAQLTAAQMRSNLMNASDQLITADWTPGKTPFENPVQGDVVWDNTRQEGYMRFVGMPKNNPTKQQYQLWIIDPARDDEPIDGGVFDIAATGETIVPINAKLGVIDPQVFAITIEKPGGVVVSTQDQLPLLAAVDAE